MQLFRTRLLLPEELRQFLHTRLLLNSLADVLLFVKRLSAALQQAVVCYHAEIQMLQFRILRMLIDLRQQILTGFCKGLIPNVIA